jgi:hypothetical protein
MQTSPQYRAAIAEFDKLWETGASKRQPERMKRLLDAIEAYEHAPQQRPSKEIQHAEC